jgi:hypothetical protein
VGHKARTHQTAKHLHYSAKEEISFYSNKKVKLIELPWMQSLKKSKREELAACSSLK